MKVIVLMIVIAKSDFWWDSGFWAVWAEIYETGYGNMNRGMEISREIGSAERCPRQSVLSIRDLHVRFPTSGGTVHAAVDVSLDLANGETVALVGETGCGKSVVAGSILQLLPSYAQVEGQIIYGGRDLLSLGEKEIAKIRGREISIIFQNPSLALNPVYTIGHQVAESALLKWGTSQTKARSMADSMLSRLGLGGLESMYPFQLSGGMNQRVMIACAGVTGPKLLIADEPTKGLDQELVWEVCREIDAIKDLHFSSMLLITHDLEVARRISDHLAVMYAGEVVEMGPTRDLLELPRHPYTLSLLKSLPGQGFHPIPGNSPSTIHRPSGCPFHPRCPFVGEGCESRVPPLRTDGRRRWRCWLRC